MVNGVHEPSEPYKLDISGGDKVDLYSSFLENTGLSTDDREFGISMSDFYGGSLLLVWDRSPDKCNRFHLTETVTIIIYATYSTDIQIDSDNNVILNRF